MRRGGAPEREPQLLHRTMGYAEGHCHEPLSFGGPFCAVRADTVSSRTRSLQPVQKSEDEGSELVALAKACDQVVTGSHWNPRPAGLLLTCFSSRT